MKPAKCKHRNPVDRCPMCLDWARAQEIPLETREVKGISAAQAVLVLTDLGRFEPDEAVQVERDWLNARYQVLTKKVGFSAAMTRSREEWMLSFLRGVKREHVCRCETKCGVCNCCVGFCAMTPEDRKRLNEQEARSREGVE